MTRTAHDQFAKQYLEELLAYLGQVKTSRDIPSEVRQVDVYFVPSDTPSTDPENLGILAQMATTGDRPITRQSKYPVVESLRPRDHPTTSHQRIADS